VTKRILISLTIGIILGALFIDVSHAPWLRTLTTGALALLLFAVGFQLGQGGDLKERVRQLPVQP